MVREWVLGLALAVAPLSQFKGCGITPGDNANDNQDQSGAASYTMHVVAQRDGRRLGGAALRAAGDGYG